MNVNYIVETEKDPMIKTWFCTVDERLRNGNGIFLSGAVHSIGRDGLYAVNIELSVGLLPFILGPFMILFGGVLAWVLWHNVALSNWLVGIGSGLLLIVYAIFIPQVHILLMRRTLKGLIKKEVKVRLATRDTIKRMAYGEV